MEIPAPRSQQGGRYPSSGHRARTISLVLFCSFLVVLPALWQSRIQAGDFSSHVYNAWLAQQIENGTVKGGLVLAHPKTNVLFDLILANLVSVCGFETAQRVAASLLLLNFFWSAFSAARVASGRAPWFLTPFLLILAHGWVYHVGFCNFYLGMGISLWALTLGWKNRPVGAALALPVLALAAVAHALPAAWAGGTMVYFWISNRIHEAHRWKLLAGSILLLAIASISLLTRPGTTWVLAQLMSATAADQALVYGGNYWVISSAIFACWVVVLIRVTEVRMLTLTGQWLLLTAAAVALVPREIVLPGYHAQLGYISDRMSLAVGVAACAVAASMRPSRLVRAGFIGLATLFFYFQFVDTDRLNRVEREMELAVAQLPRLSRVVGAVTFCGDPEYRPNPATHMIDRVCIGKCFSYGNYEPSTWQFRVRATSENGAVVENAVDSFSIRTGSYIVKERDLDLFAVVLCDPGQLRFCVKRLRAGDRTPLSCIPPQ